MGTPVSSPESIIPITMKVLLLLAFAGYASAAVTCDECNAAAQGLVERLTSEASIAEQTDILIATVCPMAPDAAACEAMLTQWWGDMANCLYPAFLGAADACERLGLCYKRTCDECTDIINTIAAFMQEEETIQQGVDLLQGDCFCGTDGHSAECPDLVASLAGPAMQVLAGVLMETSAELCQDVVGVC